MLARIEDGRVAEVRNLTLDQVPEHKRQHWREVPERPAIDPRLGALTGPHWDGGMIVWDLAQKSVAALQGEAVARLDAAVAVAVRDPDADMHLRQRTWAINHQLGNTIDDEYLAPEAKARRISLDAMAALILDRADKADQRLAALRGARTTAAALIRAAATPADVLAAEDAGVAAIEAVA